MIASRKLGVPHEASPRGMPQTSGIIEREVQDMLTGTRTLLVAAGLPGHVWSYAAPCYMHLDNCMIHPRLGQPARSKRYGEESRGHLIPFVQPLISSHPPPNWCLVSRCRQPRVCIFMGYRCAPGGHWIGEYLMEELPDFVDVDIRMDSPGLSKSLPPHVTKHVMLPAGGDIISLWRSTTTWWTFLSRAFVGRYLLAA